MALTLNCSQLLENTRREYGGVGWLGCGVVNIALDGEVGGSHRKNKIGAPPGALIYHASGAD